MREYNKTEWKNGETRVNAKNMNNIEEGISELYKNALTPEDIESGRGIRIEKEGKSTSISLRIEILEDTGEEVEYDKNTLYVLVDSENKFRGLVVGGKEIKTNE